MRYFLVVVTTCAFLNSIIAFVGGDFGYGLGLFGGAGAWLVVTLNECAS